MSFISILADYFKDKTLTDKDREFAHKQLDLFFKYADEKTKLFQEVYKPPILSS